jgi:hypothetical protein
MTNRHSLSTFFFLVLLCLVVFAGYFFAHQTKIQTIDTRLKLNANAYRAFYGKNIFTFNLAAAERTLEKSTTIYESIRLVKKYPHTLSLTGLKTTPVLQIKNQKQYLLISARGKILGLKNSQQPKLPNLEYFQILRAHQIKKGQYLSLKEISYALGLIEQAKEKKLHFQNVRLLNTEIMEITLPDSELLIVMTNKKRIANNIYFLHNILITLQKRELEPKVINLKYEKPVITL